MDFVMSDQSEEAELTFPACKDVLYQVNMISPMLRNHERNSTHLLVCIR